MNLYTVLVEFAGGTHVGQARASRPAEAPSLWLALQSDEDLTSWRIDRERLAVFLLEERVTRLAGLDQAWCIAGSLGDHFILVNIIRTYEPGIDSFVI